MNYPLLKFWLKVLATWAAISVIALYANPPGFVSILTAISIGSLYWRWRTERFAWLLILAGVCLWVGIEQILIAAHLITIHFNFIR